MPVGVSQFFFRPFSLSSSLSFLDVSSHFLSSALCVGTGTTQARTRELVLIEVEPQQVREVADRLRDGACARARELSCVCE